MFLGFCASVVRAEQSSFLTDGSVTITSLPVEEISSPLGESNLYNGQGDGQYKERGITGRATTSVNLENNVPGKLNILPNATNYYVFSNSTIYSALERTTSRRHAHLDLRSLARSTAEGDGVLLDSGNEDAETILSRRQAASPAEVYISVNTCLQPDFNDGIMATNPPQLTLYISTSTSNQLPGPDSTSLQTVSALQEGYTMVSLNTSGDVYLSISAPQATVAGSSAWNYEIAASVDAPYHSYNATGPSLKLLDSDTRAGLLVTSGLQGLSQALPASWNTAPPLSMFATSIDDNSIMGMRQSYCALAQKAHISAINNAPSSEGVQLGITTTQPGPAAEEQFYIPGLNANSTYYGFLAISGNSTDAGPNVAGGGGTMFPFMNFTTKLNSNCGLIFNLTFCSTVGYAVPANPSLFNSTQLAAAYDSSAASYIQNFTYSLQQIPCRTTPDAQYSLAKTCDDCYTAYKTWLCAVTIPRCFDFNNPPGADPADYIYLQPRNVAQRPIEGSGIAPPTNETQLNWLATNTSRNSHLIVNTIQPGPYREVLPCEDLCYDLIRSCPAKLGFACPLKGKGLEESYGIKGVSLATGGGYTCSEPGAVYYQNGDVRSVGRASALAVGVLVVLTAFWVA